MLIIGTAGYLVVPNTLGQVAVTTASPAAQSA
jgi:hypothetical protein